MLHQAGIAHSEQQLSYSGWTARVSITGRDKKFFSFLQNITLRTTQPALRLVPRFISGGKAAGARC